MATCRAARVWELATQKLARLHCTGECIRSDQIEEGDKSKTRRNQRGGHGARPGRLKGGVPCRTIDLAVVLSLHTNSLTTARPTIDTFLPFEEALVAARH